MSETSAGTDSHSGDHDGGQQAKNVISGVGMDIIDGAVQGGLASLELGGHMAKAGVNKAKWEMGAAKTHTPKSNVNKVPDVSLLQPTEATVDYSDAKAVSDVRKNVQQSIPVGDDRKLVINTQVDYEDAQKLRDKKAREEEMRKYKERLGPNQPFAGVLEVQAKEEVVSKNLNLSDDGVTNISNKIASNPAQYDSEEAKAAAEAEIRGKIENDEDVHITPQNSWMSGEPGEVNKTLISENNGNSKLTETELESQDKAKGQTLENPINSSIRRSVSTKEASKNLVDNKYITHKDPSVRPLAASRFENWGDKQKSESKADTAGPKKYRSYSNRAKYEKAYGANKPNKAKKPEDLKPTGSLHKDLIKLFATIAVWNATKTVAELGLTGAKTTLTAGWKGFTTAMKTAWHLPRNIVKTGWERTSTVADYTFNVEKHSNNKLGRAWSKTKSMGRWVVSPVATTAAVGFGVIEGGLRGVIGAKAAGDKADEIKTQKAEDGTETMVGKKNRGGILGATEAVKKTWEVGSKGVKSSFSGGLIEGLRDKGKRDALLKAATDAKIIAAYSKLRKENPNAGTVELLQLTAKEVPSSNFSALMNSMTGIIGSGNLVAGGFTLYSTLNDGPEAPAVDYTGGLIKNLADMDMDHLKAFAEGMDLGELFSKQPVLMMDLDEFREKLGSKGKRLQAARAVKTIFGLDPRVDMDYKAYEQRMEKMNKNLAALIKLAKEKGDADLEVNAEALKDTFDVLEKLLGDHDLFEQLMQVKIRQKAS